MDRSSRGAQGAERGGVRGTPGCGLKRGLDLSPEIFFII